MSGRRSRRAIPRRERAERRRSHARVCISCRRLRPKADMIRVVRTETGAAAVDRVATRPGRGAYVCPEPACLALVRRRLGAALDARRMNIDEVIRDLEAVGA